MNELLSLKATNGVLLVYGDRVVISRKSMMGFMAQGIKGDRTIYYKDLQSVEYRKPTFIANGYIQFIIAGTAHTNASVGLFGSSQESLKDPNTILLRAFNKETPEMSDKAYSIIMEKLKEVKNASSSQDVQKESAADEIRKFKSLLDEGIITKEEFDKKKSTLLGM